MYISIICLVSREHSVNLVLDNIRRNLFGDDTEIVVCVDNRNINIIELEQKLNYLKIYNPIRNISVLTTGKTPPPVFNVPQRRDRIAHAHNFIRENLGSSQFVFGFEDDTYVPKKAALRLISDFKRLPDAGFVQGVQVGRWLKPYIGAWQIDNIDEPTEYRTLKPSTGIDMIDAGGFYCFLTPTHLYKNHKFKWEEPLGPDVDYTLALRRKNYQNYIDWSIETEHHVLNDRLKVNQDIKQIKIKDKGRWLYEHK